jgi:hypothetical protein
LAKRSKGKWPAREIEAQYWQLAEQRDKKYKKLRWNKKL